MTDTCLPEQIQVFEGFCIDLIVHEPGSGENRDRQIRIAHEDDSSPVSARMLRVSLHQAQPIMVLSANHQKMGVQNIRFHVV